MTAPAEQSNADTPLVLPSRRRLAVALWATTLALVAMSLLVNWQRYEGGHGNLLGFVDFFDVDHEQSLPTYFSVSVLLAATALLGCIATVKRAQRDRFATHWRWLAVGFFYLGMDEVAGIHEKFSPVTHWLFRNYPLFPHSWTVFGLVAVTVVAALYLRFLHHLPYLVRRKIIAAGTIYLGGAIGMEIIGGAYARVNGLNFTYQIYSAIEEGMEMGGVVLFLDALLDYYAQLPQRIVFAGAATESAAQAIDVAAAPHPAVVHKPIFSS
jgi:hypothetical protein